MQRISEGVLTWQRLTYSGSNEIARLVASLLKGKYEDFAQFDSELDKLLTQVSRKLPPDFYSEIRDALSGWLPALFRSKRTRVKMVIDSNAVIRDAFRVAKHKESTTDRLFSSPFIEVFAPPNIVDEVERNLESDIPKGASKTAARMQANKVLAQVKMIGPSDQTAISKAKKQIGSRAPEDIPFLALAIQSGADAVLSYDEVAFGGQDFVKRWTFGDAAKVIVTFESGTLSMFIVAASSEAVYNAVAALTVSILRVFAEILSAFAVLTGALVAGTIEAISKVPAWVWALLGVTGAAILIYAAADENFRNALSSSVSNAVDTIGRLLRDVVEQIEGLWTAFRDILDFAWSIISPAIALMVVVAGVLLRRIVEFQGQVNKLDFG